MKRLMGDTTLLKMFPPNHNVRQGSSTNTITRFHELNAAKHITRLEPTPDVVMMLYCGNDIAYIPQQGAMEPPTPNDIINAFVEACKVFKQRNIYVIIVPMTIREDTYPINQRTYNYRRDHINKALEDQLEPLLGYNPIMNIHNRISLQTDGIHFTDNTYRNIIDEAVVQLHSYYQLAERTLNRDYYQHLGRVQEERRARREDQADRDYTPNPIQPPPPKMPGRTGPT